jgi:hypothetical protein
LQEIQISTNYYLNSFSFAIALTRKGTILFVIREVTPIEKYLKKQYNLRIKSGMKCVKHIILELSQKCGNGLSSSK